MADLLSTFANAYPYDPNAVWRGAEGMQNMMGRSLELQQKREALEAERGLRALYQQNPNPSFEEVARYSPEFAMKQQNAMMDYQGKMLGMQEKQGQINEQQAKIFALAGARVAERYAPKILEGKFTQQDLGQFHHEMGSAMADVEKQYGIKPPPGAQIQMLDPIGVLSGAAPYYKSPALDILYGVQGQAMKNQLAPGMTPQQYYPGYTTDPETGMTYQTPGTGMGAGGMRQQSMRGGTPAGMMQQSTAPDQLMPLFQQASQETGIPVQDLMAIAQQESSFSPSARSSKGAIGVMQLMPGTAQDLGVNPNDVAQNIMGGARYYKQMLERFGGDKRKALAAYNAGPGAVESAGGVPNYPETQNYVNRVGGNMQFGSGVLATPEQVAQERERIRVERVGKETEAKAAAERQAEGERIVGSFKRAIGEGGISRVLNLIQSSTSGETETALAKIKGALPMSKATAGMEDISRLRSIAGVLRETITRSPGAQSDKDVALAALDAAKIDDPSIPYNERIQGFLEFARTMKDRATALGMDPKEIGIDVDTTTGMKTAKTDAEADELVKTLKPGDSFIGPDGKTHTIKRK